MFCWCFLMGLGFGVDWLVGWFIVGVWGGFGCCLFGGCVFIGT